MTDKLAKVDSKAAFSVDAELVAESLIASFDSFCDDLKKSTAATSPGTNAQLNHLKAAMDYRLKMVDALQSLGLIPKNLGNSTKTEFVYRAYVDHIPAGKGPGQESERDATVRAALEAEYSDADKT
jgi:hypothetical protein